MTIEEIRKYRSLTSGGYTAGGLTDVSIEGIKRWREQYCIRWCNAPFGGNWSAGTEIYTKQAG